MLAALARWNVPVDDSGGDALADTPAGVFARLAAEAALGGLAPVTLLALLKHPLLRLGAAAGAHDHAIAALERAVLRGPRPSPAAPGLRTRSTTFRANARRACIASDPRWLLADAELDAAADLIAQLGAALAPLETLESRRSSARRACAMPSRRHRDAQPGRRRRGRRLRRPRRHGARQRVRRIVDSPAAAGLAVAAATMPSCSTPPSPTAWCAGRNADVRVRIYGPLEARLQNVDRVVLGGLVEGIWPPETRSDPWLSRPMRRELGLDLPERRIGLSAHDFAQALGAPEVILTRAAKLAGAPTVASRFVQRLAAVAGERAGRRARRAASTISRSRARSIIRRR